MQAQAMQPNSGQFPQAAAPPAPPMQQPGGHQRLGEAYTASQTGVPNPVPSFQATAQPAQQRQGADLSLPTLDDLIAPQQSQNLEVPETSLPDDYYQSYPTEEYIDYVVQEHMQELDTKLSAFGTRYKELEQRIMEMNEHVKQSNRGQAGEQQKVIARIDQVGESMEEVKIRLAGLEKAFKETLPALIESVRALSDIVQRMKREA
jgi:hypothetical protein